MAELQGVVTLDVAEVNNRVREQQLHLLYEQGAKGMVGTVLYAGFLAYLFSDIAPASQLLEWLGVTFCVYLSRFWLVKQFFQRYRNIETANAWHRYFLLGTVMGGAAWGIFSVLFFPASSPLHLTLFLIIISGLCASTMVTYAASGGRASAAFILPALFPLAIRCMAEGDSTFWIIGVLLLVYMVILLSSAELNVRATAKNMRLVEEARQLAEYHQQSESRATALVEQLQHEAQERHDLIASLPDVVYRTNLAGQFTFISEQVEKELGFTPDEVVGREVTSLYVEPHVRGELIRELSDKGEVRNFISALRHKNGGVVWASANLHYYRDEAGKIGGVEGISRNITQLKHAENALQSERQRLLATLESITDGVITTDTDGVVEYLNPVAERLVAEPESAVGTHYSSVLPLLDEDSGEPINDLVELAITHGGSFVHASNGLLRRKDDRSYVLKISASAMIESEGSVIGAVLVLHDITEALKMTRQLNYQASHDTLTGLVNRREFEHRLGHLIHSGHEEEAEHALFFMDLDQFKVINDTCGHRAGDELLKLLAVQLKKSLRSSDTLARLGGDEFAVLLEHCSLEDARHLAEKLRQQVKEFRFVWEDKSFEVGVSIGVVMIDRDASGIDQLLSAADAACYFAKEQGRNRVYVYHQADDDTQVRHSEMSWVHRISDAFEEQRLFLHAQHIAPLHEDSELPHYEILIRMVNEAGEIVPPMAFIPAAERYNLMPTIDRWVVRKTLSSLCEARDRLGRVPLGCSINLSGQTLADDHFLEFISEQLDLSRLDPELICFEITETAAITNLNQAMALFGELKQRGCRFSLDDFGSGLSSFGYLKTLPVDYLKIDGAFVKDILDDEIDEAMVKAIHSVGSVMELKTIAEFVENDEIAERLRTIGVDYAQGYGIARPEPLDDILQHFT